jgi:hypothetical protein
MGIMITVFEWMVSVAEVIILSVLSFFAIILLIFTAIMADILADENGELLYCETSETGVENCYMRRWNIVD